MSVPDVLLNNGVEIPQIGFGVWRVPAAGTRAAVSAALDAGFRHIDTATLYGNEEGVGAAVRESGLERDRVFVTSKVWNADQGYDETLRAFDASMGRLGFDVLDLYLIHWPVPERGTAADTWRALERLYLDGRIRAIGVSNFEPEHLHRLLETAEVVPAVNQVELHPYLQQVELRRTHEELGITTEAWSPIARGGDVLVDPVVVGLAEKHRRTTAQVILRWHLQVGNVILPRSVRPERIRENRMLDDFMLDADDLAAVAALDRSGRIGPDPGRFG